MDFGSWGLRRWDAIPRADIDAWTADLLHFRPGGAENVLDVARRVAAFTADLRATGVQQALIICHAGTIRLLDALRGAASLEQAALQAAGTPHGVEYGQVIVMDI
jgi:alpha-ribazole phosphatase